MTFNMGGGRGVIRDGADLQMLTSRSEFNPMGILPEDFDDILTELQKYDNQQLEQLLSKMKIKIHLIQDS